MKYLIHGDNHVASRQKLIELIKQAKKSGQEIISINGLTATETDLHQALESQSLFGAERLVVVEKLLSRPRSKEKDILIALLNAEPKTSIMLWEPKATTPATIKKLTTFTSEIFKTPAAIFKFLDSLQPSQPKIVLTNLHECLKADAPELVLYLFGRRVSELIVCKDKPNLLVQAPWIKSKLLAQAQKFTLTQLVLLHTWLLDLEYSHKTGASILPLASDLDLLLAKL